MVNVLEPTRRETLLLGAAALVSSLAQNVEAGQNTERHGISAFGDLKYPPDFKHFDYVDPNAPKGGVFSHIGATRAFNQNFLTFNSLNSFILKGDGAQGMELTFASLMARATDEPDAVYGLAARAVRISADGLTYRFLMRPGISFHDVSPLTAHDVAFSSKSSRIRGTRSPSNCCATSSARKRPMTPPWWFALRPTGRATCRCSRPRCRFFRIPTTRSTRSTRRRSRCRSATDLTRSDVSNPAAISSTNE